MIIKFWVLLHQNDELLIMCVRPFFSLLPHNQLYILLQQMGKSLKLWTTLLSTFTNGVVCEPHIKFTIHILFTKMTSGWPSAICLISVCVTLN